MTRYGKIRLIVGSNGSNVLSGSSRKDILVGRNGDDVLKGHGGNDLLLGGRGEDKLLGGSGNDILVGDGLWGCHWWKSKGAYDDYLDGGKGSDTVLAGRGNDLANYTLSENKRSHDYYDGGKGFDTLRLTLTSAEYNRASVQKDIAAFEAFLDRKANPNSDSGKVFQFKSFDLDVRNFEALEIRVVGPVEVPPPPANTAPVAADDAFDGDEDEEITGSVTGNDRDAEGAALTASLLAGPANGVLTLRGDGSFTYVPRRDFSGEDFFTYKVNDGTQDSLTAKVTLRVAPQNDAPLAVDDTVTLDEDSPVVIELPASDVDGDELTTEIVDEPEHGTLVRNPDGSYTYTPRADYSGTDSFRYKASDGQAESEVATLSLVISPVNDAPEAAAEAYFAIEDGVLTVAPEDGVLANDSDPDGDPLSALLVTDAANGKVTLNPDGSFTYVPDPDYVGPDSFGYLAHDGLAASAITTVSLTVLKGNDAPIASDELFTGHGPDGMGPIRVAVIGANAAARTAAATQLREGSQFEIQADAFAISGGTQWAELLRNYDVVVLGDQGFGLDYSSVPLLTALRGFVDAGGGVVTTGWFQVALQTLSGAARTHADYISPIAPAQADTVARNATIRVLDSEHPIADGLTTYTVNASMHELARGVDPGASVLATGGANRAAIVYDEVGKGLTVYFGSLQMADPSMFAVDRTPNGAVDLLFERMVAWAAGAATDEDTPLVIDDELLLANDADPNGDVLAIASVAARSAFGATVTIDPDGDIVYDPRGAPQLQQLAAGRVVSDSFDYTVSDGNGGFDTATLSLTVLGRADAEALL